MKTHAEERPKSHHTCDLDPFALERVVKSTKVAIEKRNHYDSQRNKVLPRWMHKNQTQTNLTVRKKKQAFAIIPKLEAIPTSSNHTRLHQPSDEYSTYTESVLEKEVKLIVQDVKEKEVEEDEKRRRIKEEFF